MQVQLIALKKKIRKVMFLCLYLTKCGNESETAILKLARWDWGWGNRGRAGGRAFWRRNVNIRCKHHLDQFRPDMVDHVSPNKDSL